MTENGLLLAVEAADQTSPLVTTSMETFCPGLGPSSNSTTGPGES